MLNKLYINNHTLTRNLNVHWTFETVAMSFSCTFPMFIVRLSFKMCPLFNSLNLITHIKLEMFYYELQNTWKDGLNTNAQ